jgi:ankyrin repeat protein
MTLLHEVLLGSQETMTLQDAIMMTPHEINNPDGLGYSPLHWAAQLGDVDAVATLAEHGADVN